MGHLSISLNHFIMADTDFSPFLKMPDFVDIWVNMQFVANLIRESVSSFDSYNLTKIFFPEL